MLDKKIIYQATGTAVGTEIQHIWKRYHIVALHKSTRGLYRHNASIKINVNLMLSTSR